MWQQEKKKYEDTWAEVIKGKHQSLTTRKPKIPFLLGCFHLWLYRISLTSDSKLQRHHFSLSFFFFFFCSNQLWLWDSEENTIKCICWQCANFPGSITRLQIKGHCHKQNCQSSVVILSIKVKVSYIINKYYNQ